MDRIQIETELVPSPAPVTVLLPDGYADAAEPLPLLLLLHGGNGGDRFPEVAGPLVRRGWETGALPPLVVALPNAGRSFYMDFRDGSERWESFIVGPLLERLRSSYRVAQGRDGTLVAGVSMGGMGSLRLGFKHPEAFAGVAALEPGIEPAFAFKEIGLRDRFWRSPALFERIFGSPVDEEYWAANNPASIARDEAGRLRDAGLEIYLECGDEDSFYLNHGAEFLHRVLWDAGIKHEYRSVRGADHVGASLSPRFLDAFAFLKHVLLPPAPDPALPQFHRMMEQMKRRAGYTEE